MMSLENNISLNALATQNKLYMNFYKEKLITILLTDDLDKKQVLKFGNMLKFFIENGLQFILCVTPKNKFTSLKDYSSELRQQQEEEYLGGLIIELCSLLDRLDVETKIITDIDAESLSCNSGKVLDMNIDKINDYIGQKIIPIFLPLVTDKKTNQRSITNLLHFTKEISLKLNSKKIIISTNLAEEIRDISMMSSDQVNYSVYFSEQMSYITKTYLCMLRDFVKENPEENRGHIVGSLKEILTEILYIEGVGTMVSDHVVESVSSEKELYKQDLFKREY